ncbi:hypothetical protein ABGB16_27000 [Micromonospora sp. B11E3]|uniref:hypothetical protein n=1 Tax=Micromonospora sp. B11E3 TaxID=3153562 RepID=UPI00325E9B57
MLGVAGVPEYGVSGVLVDVTAISPTANIYLTAFPEGTTRPVTSTVNAHTGEIISTTLVVKVGASGNLSVYTSGGNTHILVDVHGYFSTVSPEVAATVVPPPALGGGFVSVLHSRVVDTRDGSGTTAGTVPNGGTRTFTLTGGSIPAGAAGALLDVTVVGSTGSGYLTAYPAGGTADTKSMVDYVGGTTSQGVAVKLSATGGVTVKNHGPAVHLVISIQGYVTATARTGAGLRAVPPTRLLDTRANGGTAIPANGTIGVQISGSNGIPLRDMDGAFLNLTVVSPTGTGFLSVKPDDGWPVASGAASVANFTAGQHARSTMVVVKGGKVTCGRCLGSDGRILIKNVSGGTIHLLVDLHGWFGPPRTL